MSREMGTNLTKIIGTMKEQLPEGDSHSKEEHFIRNGAVLLEKRVSLFRGKDLGCEPCKIFSADDIRRATGNYDRRRIIGRKIATVFKGELDGRTVAIKTVARELANEDLLGRFGVSWLVNFFLNQAHTQDPCPGNYDRGRIIGRKIATVFKGELNGRTVAIKSVARDLANKDLLGRLGVSWLVDFFLNQVAIKEVINHKHILSLHGCCLETEVPCLVFEFVTNGTLHDHLHRNPSTVSWPERVRIAMEVSQALAYMHLGTWKPIVHLDVKSSNVFLDENFTAKLSNFGFSVPISPGDEYSQRGSLDGTPGYIDPEYQETLRVNEKCDVYGFGVLLAELLTGYDPLELMKNGNGELGDKFLSAMVGNRVLEIVDERILEETKDHEIQQFCKVASRCLGKGVDRPTMPEVATELRQIYHQILS